MRVLTRAAVRRLLPFLALLPFLYACEETLTDTGIDVPYEEELVVQGYLSQGSAADSIWITRTLPPLQTWTIERAAVTDADVVITVDGVEHPLHHTADGHYVIEGLAKVPGASYRLRVTSGDRTVNATATIPEPTVIRRSRLDTIKGACRFSGGATPEIYDRQVLLTYYLVAEETVYGLAYETTGTWDSSSYTSYGTSYLLYEPNMTGELTFDLVFMGCLDDTDPFRVDTVFATLYSYEPAFTRYYETRWNGDDDDLLFGPSGEDPDWNVEGDGFGWFFGRAVDYDTLVVMPD